MDLFLSDPTQWRTACRKSSQAEQLLKELAPADKDKDNKGKDSAGSLTSTGPGPKKKQKRDQVGYPVSSLSPTFPATATSTSHPWPRSAGGGRARARKRRGARRRRDRGAVCVVREGPEEAQEEEERQARGRCIDRQSLSCRFLRYSLSIEKVSRALLSTKESQNVQSHYERAPRYTTLHYTSILYLVSPLPSLPFQLSCGGQRDWDWIPARDRSAPRRPQGRAIGQGRAVAERSGG